MTWAVLYVGEWNAGGWCGKLGFLFDPVWSMVEVDHHCLVWCIVCFDMIHLPYHSLCGGECQLGHL